jgi:hypothetical protein
MIILFLAVLIPFSLTSAPASAAPQISTTARFRVVVAASLSTNVDVWVDGVITSASGLLSSVKPLDASGYLSVTGGSHTITLYQTATTTPVGTPFTYSFTAGTDTSVALLADMTWMTIPDINVAPLPLQATARLVNLSASTNPVSLSVDAVTPPAFTAIAFKSTSASYLAYPIGLHSLAIPGNAVKPVSYNFQDGHVYSIFIFWNALRSQPRIVAKSDTTFIKSTPTATLGFGTPSPTVGPTLPPGTSTPRPTGTVGAPRGNTNATIRLINAVNGASVDLLVDNLPTKITKLAFTKASTYIPVTGSALGTPHTITVVATGTTTILATYTANFLSQVDQSLILMPGSSRLTALTDQNINPNSSGHTGFVAVRFVNLTLDGQAMDLYVDGSPVPVFHNIAVLGASSYQYEALVPHTLEIHQSSTGSVVIPAAGEQFLGDRVYTVFVFEATPATPTTIQMVIKADAQFYNKILLPMIMH